MTITPTYSGVALATIGGLWALLFFCAGRALARREKMPYVVTFLMVWVLALLGAVLGWIVSDDPPVQLAWYIGCFMCVTAVPVLLGAVLAGRPKG